VRARDVVRGGGGDCPLAGVNWRTGRCGTVFASANEWQVAGRGPREPLPARARGPARARFYRFLGRTQPRRRTVSEDGGPVDCSWRWRWDTGVLGLRFGKSGSQSGYWRKSDCSRIAEGLEEYLQGGRCLGDTRVQTSGSPSPTSRWQWIPTRATPVSPRPGGSALAGDIPELLQHLRQIRGQGATISEAEQVWLDGMSLINQRAAQFPGNGPVVNLFYGVVGGEWRVYVGRPAAPGQDTFALAFNVRTGAIAQGLFPSGIRPHPTQPGQEALFNFQILYP
jgi:hypothetical protein